MFMILLLILDIMVEDLIEINQSPITKENISTNLWVYIIMKPLILLIILLKEKMKNILETIINLTKVTFSIMTIFIKIDKTTIQINYIQVLHQT